MDTAANNLWETAPAALATGFMAGLLGVATLSSLPIATGIVVGLAAKASYDEWLKQDVRAWGERFYDAVQPKEGFYERTDDDGGREIHLSPQSSLPKNFGTDAKETLVVYGDNAITFYRPR